MTVTVKHILPGIPEVLLRPILIARTRYLRVLNPLDIKRGDFNDDAGDRKHLLNCVNKLEVCIELMLDGRCQPTFRLYPVVKPRLPVPQAVSPGSAVRAPLGVKFNNVSPQCRFRSVQLLRGGNGREPDVGIAAANS